MKTFRKTVSSICKASDSISMIMLCVCVSSAFLNTVFRYVFNAPLRWSEELCVITLIWMVYISLPSIERTNNQLCMTALYNMFPQKIKDIVNILRSIVTVFICYIVTKTGWALVERNFELKINTQVFNWPYGIIYFIIPLCFALIIIVRISDVRARIGTNEEFTDSEPTLEEAKK
jgi:TRAP-type C4-dicarboxylate transport system permease small subunit